MSYINELNHFKKSVDIINRKRIFFSTSKKKSIDMSDIRGISKNLFGVVENKAPKINLKFHFKFRKMFIQVRAINILLSGKSLHDRLEDSFVKMGLIEKKDNSLRHRMVNNAKKILECNNFDKIIEEYIENRIEKDIIIRKPYIIYSDSYFKLIFEAIMCIILIFITFYYSYTATFSYYQENTFDYMMIIEIFIDGFFLIDLIISFFTAIDEVNGIVIDDISIISKRYLKSWFIFDLFSLIPLYLVDYFYEQNYIKFNYDHDEERILSILRILKVIRFLKLTKLFKENLVIEKIFYYFKLKQNIKKILVNFYFLFLTIHFVACSFYYIVSLNYLDNF